MTFEAIIDNPIFNCLLKTENEFLYRMVQIFNSCDITEFEQFWSKLTPTQINLFGDKVQNIQRKFKIISLLDFFFRESQSHSCKRFTFQRISNCLQIDPQFTEALLIHVLSIGKIKGKIDDID